MLSKSYLRACGVDITAATAYIKDPNRLFIVSAGAGPQGDLAEFLVPADARLQAQLGGTRRALNARIGAYLLSSGVRTRDEATGHLERLLAAQPPIPRYNREKQSDHEILGFIAGLLALPLRPRLRALTRLRPALRPRLGRILRRRTRRVPRIPAQLLLQPSDPLLQSHHRTRQAENHLNTTLPPRVVNRLRLGAVHTPKIRRITRRSLLWRPTSERLRKGLRIQVKPDQAGLFENDIREETQC